MSRSDVQQLHYFGKIMPETFISMGIRLININFRFRYRTGYELLGRIHTGRSQAEGSMKNFQLAIKPFQLCYAETTELL